MCERSKGNNNNGTRREHVKAHHFGRARVRIGASEQGSSPHFVYFCPGEDFHVKVSASNITSRHPKESFTEHTRQTCNMATDDPAAPSQQQRPSQVRIHLHTNSEDIELPQDTGPILVSTGESGAGAALIACTILFSPPATRLPA